MANLPSAARRQRDAYAHRLQRLRSEGMVPHRPDRDSLPASVSIDCGWGRLIFAQTFASPAEIVETLRQEVPGRRDIVFYVRDPHVLIAEAPAELFLDPSHAYRLHFEIYRGPRRSLRGVTIRRLTTLAQAEAVNRIYSSRGMVPVPPKVLVSRRSNRVFSVLVAVDEQGVVLGTAMGVDHRRAFSDPENGTTLWCLATDPHRSIPGVGEALVHRLAGRYKATGASFMDLSVMHDNAEAIALYEKIGFVRVPFFAVKRRNSFNQPLYSGPAPEAALNPYGRIIADEARRRGIEVQVTDAEAGLFRLIFGARAVHCRESLSELTSAVAMSICDDKSLTRKIVERAGVRVPAQILVGDIDHDALAAFVAEHKRVVVKPARGEQGKGVVVGLTDPADVARAVAAALRLSSRAIVEAFVPGRDLRLVIIDYKLVAAAIRRPARIVGDGRRTVRELIARQSRRRQAATGGESRIPMDAETRRCLAEAGLEEDTVPDAGAEIVVRKTANLHTGGTIEDVTDIAHPMLVEAAVKAARAIDIPVVGIDLMVEAPDAPDYMFIEANERPGLANHEPQPTAERFIDLLFPQTVVAPARDAVR